MQYLESFDNKNDDYSSILKFSEKNNNITYDQFDEHILKDINLFDVPNDDYFKTIGETLNKIINTLPAIKRILAKPVVYLKDKQEIVPVEAVKVINNYTISHAALHSELWGDITEEGLKPKKLMTLEKEETYAIYENIAFSRLIDAILGYIKKSIVLMKDILYGCQDIHFNLLDRTHHKLYFLAIGKLHIEYAQAHESHYSTYFNFIEKLLFIDKTLRPKLNSPVYIQCKKNKNRIKLKKTNVFRSHKDYKQIYNLLKWFESDILEQQNIEFNTEVPEQLYRDYVSILSIFSIGHFNFKFKKNEKINFCELNTKCTFNDWKLHIKYNNFKNINYLNFEFNKDLKYNICLILNEKDKIDNLTITEFKKNNNFNEYLFTSSINYGVKDTVYLSIYDIDSFRRIQQLLLRGMIYSDDKHDICPFCGHALKCVNDIYECEICRAEITKCICPQTNEMYYVSFIKKYKSGINNFDNYLEKRKFLHDRLTEAQFHFRNITQISSDGKVICPKCGKKHN